MHTIPPDDGSPPEDLARNTARSGFPHPLESSEGWGGGADKWDIVEGVRNYAQWHNGLAFTGGAAGWVRSCGIRWATINFGPPKTFNSVLVWHHGLEHVPNAYSIQYWDGAQWVTVFSTTQGHNFLKFPTPTPTNWWESWSTPTENTFDPVTATKVRMELNNCDITHGWIYEFEVYHEVTNQVPVVDAGPDQVVECSSHDGSAVSLDGSASSDPDGEIKSYEWFSGGDLVAMGPTPTVSLGLGVHDVTLRVTDDADATAEDEVTITVQDTQAPAIELVVSPTELWPPNHKMVRVASGVSASDICDANPSLSVTVSSNEPVDGLGDGDTAPDWQIVDNGDGTFDVWVRAERSGTGTGRVYTVTATATDASGNVATSSGMVTVPHSRSRAGAP